MKETILTIILSIFTLASAYFVYTQLEPTQGYQVGFCKTIYNGNTDKINECLDNYDEMHGRTGYYDKFGNPIQ